MLSCVRTETEKWRHLAYIGGERLSFDAVEARGARFLRPRQSADFETLLRTTRRTESPPLVDISESLIE